MRNQILTRLLDILCADARLYAGGSAWAAGFSGVKRYKTTGAAAAGWVNVFDHAYTISDKSNRPAIYVGMPGMGSRDRQIKRGMAQGALLVQLRVITLPLIICARANGLLAAEQQRDQIAGNIQDILDDHVFDTPNWFQLEYPGDAGGGSTPILTTSSSTGGTAVGDAQASVALPIMIQYSRTRLSGA